MLTGPSNCSAARTSVTAASATASTGQITAESISTVAAATTTAASLPGLSHFSSDTFLEPQLLTFSINCLLVFLCFHLA
jgi:hypothetical protein